MNILHLISSGGFYGAERVVSALTRDLRNSGHWAAVGLFENRRLPGTKVVDQFESGGVELMGFPGGGRAVLQTVAGVRKLTGKKKLDILHTHGYKADIYGHLAPRRSRTPTIATCHLWTRQTRAVRFYEMLDAWV